MRHRSFCLDLDTLLWTTLIWLPRVGSYAPSESLLFVGPITRFVRRYMNWFVADLLVALAVVGCSGSSGAPLAP